MTAPSFPGEKTVDWYPMADHFEKLGSSLGDHSICLRIGTLSLTVKGLAPRIVEAANKQYGTFLVEERTPRVSITLFPGKPGYLKPAEDGFLRLEETEEKNGRMLLSHDFAAFHKKEECALRISNPEDKEAVLRAVENCIRWIVADHAINHGGFVLHAAGLVKNGGAYVFFGPSGAGKSTVTELSQGCPILSDDLVLLRKTQAGWVAATTPFAGTFPQEGKASGEYPLKGLFRLIQAERDELLPLSKGLAVGKVLSCCPFVGTPSKRHDLLLPLVTGCCGEIPTHDLFFRKTPNFWNDILETNNG